MKIKCVFGDNFHDITSGQIRLIGEGLKENRKQLIIVPDRFSLTMERRVLKELNLRATFDIDVVSFARLANKVLTRVQSPQILSSLGATMVIEMLLTKHENELVCFKNTAKTIAFAGVLFDSIAQLKSCKISPVDLERNIDNLRNSALRLKLKDIALIYKYYEEFLSTQYMDSNNRLKLLGKEIAEGHDFEDYDIHICQFDNITSQGLDLINILTQKANSMSVGILFPNKEQNNREVYTQELANYILPLAKKLNITPDYIEVANTLPNFSKHILNNLMSINPDTIEIAPSNLNIYSASNINSEIEWIAKDILQKTKQGARFNEIVLNCASLENYAPVIKRIFDKYNIPFWADLPFKLADSEGAKYLFTALDCVQDNFQVKDVLRFAKNSLTGLSLQDFAVFENVIKKYGIVGTRFADDTKPEFPDDEFDKYIEIKQFMQPLFTLNKNIHSSVNVAEIISAIHNFFEETNLYENLNGMAQSFEEQGDLLKQSIARQNFDKLDAVLHQMQEILGQMELNFDNFCKIFRAGVATVTISPLPMSVDCVYVGQNLQSVFSRAPYYYIVGAIEGSLPAWVADAGLIADYDIAELGENAVRISPTIRQVNARSRLNVLQNFAMAEKELMISYPVNSGGEKCEPASIISSLQKIFTFKGQNLPIITLSERLIDDNAFGGEAERIAFLWSNKDECLQEIIRELSDRNSRINPKILATAWQFLSQNGYSEILNQVLSNINNQSEIATLKDPQSVFFIEDKARVTQIEKFFECPYAHFLTYGLGLQQKKTAKPEAVDIGNILHAVFEKFGKMYRSHEISDAEIETKIPQIFREVLKQKQFSHIVYAGQSVTLLSSLEQEAVLACKAISYQLRHSGYKIKFVETSFGSEHFAKIPEVAIINTKKSIKINGKIDRVDICGDKLRIIDYKTSKTSGTFNLLNFYLGKKIQLFYYMQAILADLGLQAGGAYYLPVHREYSDENSTLYSSYKLDGISLYTPANMFAQDNQINYEHAKSDIVNFSISTSKENIESGTIVLKSSNLGASEEQFKNLLKYAKCVLEGAINDIYDGEISPLFVGKACDYCQYKYICKKNVLQYVKERASNFNVKIESFDLGEKNAI